MSAKRFAAILSCFLIFPAVRLAAQAPSTGPAFEIPRVERVEPIERPEGGEIETDRDSFTPATTTAGRGRLIVESAYTFLDNRRVKETHSLPELVLRYGLTDRVELRLGWNYEVGGAGNDTTGSGSGETDTPFLNQLERESNFAYGVKLKMTETDAFLPGSALILQAFTPTSGPATDTRFVGTYVFGWDLPGRMKLDAAIRYSTASEEEDRFNVWAPSVVLKAPLGEKWDVHVEYFSVNSAGRDHDFTRQYISPGAHYLLNENLEVGVRIGWGLNDQSARFFCNAGVGMRF